MKTQKNSLLDFKGFDDFVEVFRAGQQTDSAGKQHVWTVADLDQMVANHSPAPIVVGHPKTNDPAYGWTHALKRSGDILLAKFENVEPQFSQMVADKRFPNRSIRIVKTDSGLKLGHVGFLGAVPPAITGLKPIEFNQAGVETFDFECYDWQTPRTVVQLFRNLREFILTKFTPEEADKVVSNWQLDDLSANADKIYQDWQQDQAEITPNDPSQFSQGDDMPTKEELEAEQRKVADFAAQNQLLQQQLETAKKAARKTECQAVIDSLLQKGVKPAALIGVADFMAALPTEAESFEFSQGEGDKAQTVKTSSLEFFKGLLNHLPSVVKTGQFDFGGNVDAPNTTDGIVKAATAYQFAEKQAGREVSVSEAVIYVTTRDK